MSSEVRCSSAQEFLELLHPRHEMWRPSAGSWIFRGHGDSEWKLVPKAWRREAWEEFSRRPFEPSSVPEWERSQREAGLLIRFGTEVDQIGLPLPERSHEAVELLEKMVRSGSYSRSWMRQCVNLAALAQHHGLPTRLLDFTEHARIAAYFAAATKPKTPAENLCVWAVHRWFVDEVAGAVGPGLQLWLLRAPGASNPNLHAQSGLFLTWNGDDRVLSLEDVVQLLGGACESVLWRLLLPRTEVPELLKLLAYERITGATMFPNADGVVASIKEQISNAEDLLDALRDEPAAERG